MTQGKAFVIEEGHGIYIKITNLASTDGKFSLFMQWWED